MAKFMDDYLNEWISFGGIPHRRSEVYRFMQDNGVRYMSATLEQPALEPDAAEELRARFDAEGITQGF